jgi:hypothetical protein
MADFTETVPLFEKICREILSRLGDDTSDRAVAFTAESRDLLATLDRWQHYVPAQHERAALISRVLDLNRAVLEYLAARKA